MWKRRESKFLEYEKYKERKNMTCNRFYLEGGSNENEHWKKERENESGPLISFCRKSKFCRRRAATRPTYIITCDLYSKSHVILHM